MNKFYWNEDTLEYFKTMNKEYPQFLEPEIKIFVKSNCELEGEETYEDLTNDLMKQVK